MQPGVVSSAVADPPHRRLVAPPPRVHLSRVGVHHQREPYQVTPDHGGQLIVTLRLGDIERLEVQSFRLASCSCGLRTVERACDLDQRLGANRPVLQLLGLHPRLARDLERLLGAPQLLHHARSSELLPDLRHVVRDRRRRGLEAEHHVLGPAAHAELGQRVDGIDRVLDRLGCAVRELGGQRLDPGTTALETEHAPIELLLGLHVLDVRGPARAGGLGAPVLRVAVEPLLHTAPCRLGIGQTALRQRPVDRILALGGPRRVHGRPGAGARIRSARRPQQHACSHHDQEHSAGDPSPAAPQPGLERRQELAHAGETLRRLDRQAAT